MPHKMHEQGPQPNPNYHLAPAQLTRMKTLTIKEVNIQFWQLQLHQHNQAILCCPNSIQLNK